MKVGEVQELVARVAAVDADCADWAVLQGAVGQLRTLKSWVEGREVLLAGLVAKVSSFPEKSLAEAGKSNLREGERLIKRAGTVEQIPTLGEALEAGRVSAGHVDVLTRVLAQLQPVPRQQLIDAGPSLVAIAENTTADEFARTVGDQARRLECDGDGLERLERQRRAVRFDSWVDRQTGMGRWSATWDPETMVRLENLIDAKVQALFHDTQPANCPTDLLAKQSFLRAHSMLDLLNGGGSRLGRPEIVVVVDHTHPDPDGRPFIDWGLPVDLPDRVLADVARRADMFTVVVRNGVVIDAPGELNLGRTTRIANRAQRRALGALYATCAIPGCQVRYSRTKLHHVIWWRHHGLTNLDNLLPLCEHHHQNVHHNGWILALTPDRMLTIQFPDGQIMTTGPPQRGAA
jgi:hypothetical protein